MRTVILSLLSIPLLAYAAFVGYGFVFYAHASVFQILLVAVVQCFGFTLAFGLLWMIWTEGR